jgi:hypothetical protein
MKPKHGRAHAQVTVPRIKVITDPKKLAWLKAKLKARTERRKAAAKEGPLAGTLPAPLSI